MHRVEGSKGRAVPLFQRSTTALQRPAPIGCRQPMRWQRLRRLPCCRTCTDCPCHAGLVTSWRTSKSRLFLAVVSNRQIRCRPGFAAAIERLHAGLQTALRCAVGASTFSGSRQGRTVPQESRCFSVSPAVEHKPQRAMHILVRVPSMNESPWVCSTSARASQASTAGDAAVARGGLQEISRSIASGCRGVRPGRRGT